MVRGTFGKRVVLASMLVLMVNLIAPTRMLSTCTFMPIGEAQAQQGGGPMKNNELKEEQGKRADDALKGLSDVGAGGGEQAGPNGGQALENGAKLLPNDTKVMPKGQTEPDALKLKTNSEQNPILNRLKSGSYSRLLTQDSSQA